MLCDCTILVLTFHQEGPHSALNEEEFYDAIEVALDRQDEEDAMVSSISIFQQQHSFRQAYNYYSVTFIIKNWIIG